jgi:hypothetical protein
MATKPAALPGVVSQDQLFWYPIVPAQLQGNQQNVAANVQIQNDADFDWRWIIASSTGLFSVLLTDDFMSKPLMPSSTPINSENIVGTAQLPFVLPKPYRLNRTATVSALFNDRSGAPNTVQFCLVGYKLFSQR